MGQPYHNLYTFSHTGNIAPPVCGLTCTAMAHFGGSPLATSTGEVAPGPPLLQAGPFSSAPGEDASSLCVGAVGAVAAGEAGTPVEAALLVALLGGGIGCCCSLLSWFVLVFFSSAGTGISCL